MGKKEVVEKDEFKYCNTCKRIQVVRLKETPIIKDGVTSSRPITVCKKCTTPISIADGVEDKGGK